MRNKKDRGWRRRAAQVAKKMELGRVTFICCEQGELDASGDHKTVIELLEEKGA